MSARGPGFKKHGGVRFCVGSEPPRQTASNRARGEYEVVAAGAAGPNRASCSGIYVVRTERMRLKLSSPSTTLLSFGHAVTLPCCRSLLLDDKIEMLLQGAPHRQSYCEGSSEWCYCTQCLLANALKRCTSCSRYISTRRHFCVGCKSSVPTKEAQRVALKLAKAAQKAQQGPRGQRRQAAPPSMSQKLMTGLGLQAFDNRSALEAASSTPVVTLTLAALVNQDLAVQTGFNMTSNKNNLVVSETQASKKTNPLIVRLIFCLPTFHRCIAIRSCV